MSESENQARINNFKEHGTQDFNEKIVDVLVESMGGAEKFAMECHSIAKNGIDEDKEILIDQDKIAALYEANRQEILEVAGYVNEAFTSIGEWMQFTDSLSNCSLDEIYAGLYSETDKRHLIIKTLFLELCHNLCLQYVDFDSEQYDGFTGQP